MDYKKLKNKYKRLAEKQHFYYRENEDSFEIQDICVSNNGRCYLDDGINIYRFGKSSSFKYIDDLIIAILTIRSS